MQSGTIRPDRPLLVVALSDEAEMLDSDLPILITGMGKVNAALALTAVLAAGPRPSALINLGTAGSLRGGITGTHEVSRVIQHDIDARALYTLTGHLVGPPLTVAERGLTLASGDQFVAEETTRTRLADHAHLVDMEGYALATVASHFSVPIRLIKHVSDQAGSTAAATWQQNLHQCARALATWLRDNRHHQ
ncbi:nucleosidase [Actinoplanes ianthinogenes]|uniref:Nucleosidase n=1 Tax=Actinoplanes ianthinogenes TaxID=122358 RepID=A0ABM7LXQ1_9ACTN|nr:nucleosidase [Actinoplanes ianthinogenes]BCJ44123.1 nucleosidase [Actinoplanes ianthinogenes]GGQ95935.1 nucleosidase [Actinoplanes ianthinogenes]